MKFIHETECNHLCGNELKGERGGGRAGRFARFGRGIGDVGNYSTLLTIRLLFFNKKWANVNVNKWVI